MWAAAPTSRKVGLAAFVIIAALSVVSVADARTDLRSSEVQPQKIWAVQVGPRTMGVLNGGVLVNLKRSGVNTLVLQARLTRRQVAKARAVARIWGFTVISPFSE